MSTQSVEMTSVAKAGLLIAANLCDVLAAKGLLSEAEFTAMINKIVREVAQDDPEEKEKIRRTIKTVFPHVRLDGETAGAG